MPESLNAARNEQDKCKETYQGTTVNIPTIITERLVLRAFSPADLGPYSEMNADPQTMRYLGEPFDDVGTWRLMASLIGHWHLRGFGMWAVQDGGTGEFLGRAGLYEQHGWPGTEVAWSIRRDRWGQGLATEAGSAALDFAMTVVGATEVISLIHPKNVASMRVAEKLGLSYARTESVSGAELSIYATHPNWRGDRK